MKLLNRLERKFGRYAIPNIMKYIVVLFILGLLIGSMPPYTLYQFFDLDFDLVLRGQVWRLVTFIIPVNSLDGILFLAISIYFYYMIGNALERAWGAFRFNLYFFSGIFFNLLSSLITYLISGVSLTPSLQFICGTMFFAFAAIYPNTQFYIYFLIPVKAKYLAWFQGALYVFTVYSYISRGQFLPVIPLLVAFGNFFIFFFATRDYHRISPSEYKRKANYHRQMNDAKNTGNVVQFNGRNVVTRHKCAVCGKTEMDNDQLEFRFCSKCDGNYEYCMEHLFTHEHVHK
jgi:hypothetical protein